MKLRLSSNYTGVSMDPATIMMISNAVSGAQQGTTQSEAEASGQGVDPSTFNTIAQYAAVIDKFVTQAEKQRLEELIEFLKGEYGFNSIEALSNEQLLTYAIAFDQEIKRIQNNMSPANTPQGRIDRRYIAAFKVLNAAIDVVASERGYKRVGSVGTPANAYFLKIADVDPTTGKPAAPAPSGSILPTMAGIPNLAVLGLVGALGYMLLKK